jgi:hypothetical protein
VNLIISDTFTKALGKLTQAEQSVVKQAAFDFQLNPSSPGFNFEQLERPKDPNCVRAASIRTFASASINSGTR